ncbi:hypothetical protein AB0K21_21685 [Streptosporangium sp. NPDC049248]|uniref:DUF6197 family protein n=1 Tax=Streptosporangium sp. NPDC049248 TaxID=3155651 RepID=UPI0034472CD5
MNVSGILIAVADRIGHEGWAASHQQPGIVLSDAVAIEVRDVPVSDAVRAELQAATFGALRRHTWPSTFNDWLHAPERTQAEVIAALHEAAKAEAIPSEPENDMPWFWGPGGERGLDDPAKRVVVNGEHYLICGDETGGFRGYGGRRFDIEFFDGRTATTRNLWCQGTIPPRWRDRYPDNARFVTRAKTTPTPTEGHR